jgi:Rrf2 family transcriptional regulator, cysteine metabolism repressor
MLNITRRTEYGLMAALHMMDSGENLVSAKELSEIYNIPKEILAKVLQRMAAGELISAVKGASGGYRLAADPRSITLTKLIEVIEGPVGIVDCVAGRDKVCHPIRNCTIRHSMAAINKKILAVMNEVTLSKIHAGELD